MTHYKNKLFLVAALISLQIAQAKQQIQIGQIISQRAFDKRTGGLLGGCATANTTKSLFYIYPNNNDTTYTLVPLGDTGDANTNNRVITALALGHLSDENPYAAIVTDNLVNRIILKTLNNDFQENATIGLVDAAGGNATVMALTATNTIQDTNNNINYNFAIAALKTTASTFLGNNNSRFALLRFTNDDITDNALSYTAAFTPGDNAIDGGRQKAVIIDGQVTLKWNDKLQRLYVGIGQVRSGLPTQYNGGGGVVAANDNFDDDGLGGQVAITLSCFSINGAFNGLTNLSIVDTLTEFGTGADAGNSSIVGVHANNITLSLNTFDFMHTSTDKHYILINGGKGTLTETATKIFALPLVGPEGNKPGALALVSNRNQNQLTIDFNTRAQVAGDLFSESHAPAIVGNRALPGGTVSQLEGVGDTVYCSTIVAPDANNEPGLYYSQAIFNNSGAIVRWTDWAKAVPNHISNNNPDAVTDASCYGFAIDAKRGRIITIGNERKGVITTTEWKYLTDADSFTGQINRRLNGPCYSHLILDQYVKEFGNRTTGRFILLGGDNKVVVAKTGVGRTAAYGGINTSVTDWTAATAQAIDMSRGLEQAGRIHCLAYTQNDDEDNGVDFFLAGTETGLYIYDKNGTGEGFEANAANAFTNLNHVASVFNTGKWQKYTGISNPVHKIVIAPGGHIYVLVKKTNNNKDNTDAIDSVEHLFLQGAEADTIAGLSQESVHSQELLENLFITDIYDIMTVKGANNTTTLLAATNRGILAGINRFSMISNEIVKFFSKPQRTLDENEVFHAVSEIYYPSDVNSNIRHTFKQGILSYISSDIANPTSQATRWADRLIWHPAQGITTDAALLNMTEDNVDQHLNFFNLNKITTPLYTNGSLRFFGMLDENIDYTTNSFPHRLVALPFRTDSLEYNVNKIERLVDTDLQDIKTVYWINNGGAGYTLMGTNKGILSLE